MVRGVFAAAALAALASPATAATLTVTSVTGLWENSDPVVSGLGTTDIRWGTNIGFGQSGYSFDASATPATVAQDTDFVLGTFEHLNHTIRGTFLETVDLALSFTIAGLADPISTVFSFSHWETLNQAKVCPNGANWTGINISGCADRVTATLNLGQSETFQIGGVTYLLDITGFLYNGVLMDYFWTQEQKDNQALLMARFTVVPDNPPPPPPPPEVPLPASVFLLLGGLGGMSLLRRRR